MIFPATATAIAGSQLEHDVRTLLIEHGVAYRMWQETSESDKALLWKRYARVDEIERRIMALATGWRDAYESEVELACPHCSPDARCMLCMADAKAAAMDRAVDAAKDAGL